ncbi:MAG TPA: hypothetical protein VG675_02790 [Bryobacteraceae bacterium]|nr:hypothetical protein [Bryobacteraceae bacterium]
MSGWQVDASVAQLGSIALPSRNVSTGAHSLQLIPNSHNTTTDLNPVIYAAGQGISAQGLWGKQLYVSASMQADAGSVAILRIYAFSTLGTPPVYHELRQLPSASGPVRRRDVFEVPNDPHYVFLLIGCMVEGTSGSAYFDDVSLTAGVPATWLEANGTPDTGSPYAATVTVNAKQRIRAIPSTLYGTNLEWPDDGDGLWNEQTQGLDASMVSLAKQMGVTLERFPGGIFSDYYSWRDGIGPQAGRPQTPSYPGGPLRAHHFGTDEALSFAKATNGQLLITVNIITGTPQQAADWVSYVNGAGERVQYWEIGNESYNAGTSGTATISALDPQTYGRRFLEFAQAMRAADPKIKLGAIVDENYSHSLPRAYPEWTDQVLAIAGSQIDFLAVHCGYAPVVADDLGWSPRTVYSAMLAAPVLIKQQLASLSSRIARDLPSRAAQIPVAITEWGPLFQGDASGRFVDHTKTLGSALFVADTLKTFVESPQTQIANMFKLVDANFLGAVGMRNGTFAAKATDLAFQMFTTHFGVELVNSQTQSPVYDAPTVGWVDSTGQVPYLDVVSSTSSDGKTLYVLGINKHFDRAIRAHVVLNGFSPSGSATVYTLDGTGADANTGTSLFQMPGLTWAKQAQIMPDPRFYSGGPDEVTITTSSIPNPFAAFDYTFPAHSVTSIVLKGN